MEQEFNPQFQKIGDILVHEGKISDSQLNSALAEQKVSKEKLGTELLDQGLITEDDLIMVYSMQLGYDLANDEDLFSANPEIVETIPEDFARQNMVLALRKSDAMQRYSLLNSSIGLKGALIKRDILEFIPPPAMSNNGKPEPVSS